MKILVAGAGGYLGIPLCMKLLTLGHEVVALDRFFFGRERFAAAWAERTIAKAGTPEEKAALLRSSFTQADTRAFDTDLLRGADAVVDLAGLSNDACGDLSPALTEAINVGGARALLREAYVAGVRRYVYSSSASVYGHGTHEDLEESDDCNPQTEYAKSKLRVEGAIRAMPEFADASERKRPFETVVLRNATLYGVAPRMRWDLVVNVMTMRAWKDSVIYVMGGGEQWRPLLHVEDCVEAFVAALTAPAAAVAGRTFNVGERNMRVREIASIVSFEFQKAAVHAIPDGPDKRDYHLHFGAFARATGWEPTHSVHEGVGELAVALQAGDVRADDPTGYTVNWYKSILEWERRIRELAIDGKVLA